MSSDQEISHRRRGRPPGSRNKPKRESSTTFPADGKILTPPARLPMADYKAADPDTIIARQLSMLDWAQLALRNEMERGYQAKGLSIQTSDLDRLETMSNAIVRAVDALKKSSDLSEELARRMTPEKLLEAALAKVEAQDVATIRYAIKRLRLHLERVTPVSYQDRQQMKEVAASGAVSSLETE